MRSVWEYTKARWSKHDSLTSLDNTLSTNERQRIFPRVESHLKFDDAIKRVLCRDVGRYMLRQVLPPRWGGEAMQNSDRAEIKEDRRDNGRF